MEGAPQLFLLDFSLDLLIKVDNISILSNRSTADCIVAY